MDNNIFVISDTWFNRPIGYKSEMGTNEYNDEIIKKWNDTVGINDDVYVLGGFGVSDLYNIAIKLNGRIHFLNNYYTTDEKMFFDNLKICSQNSYDNNVSGKLFFYNEQIVSLNDDDIILSYFPLSNWYGKNTGTMCFHGLTDETNLKEGNISCCLLKNNIKPLNIREVKEKIYNYSNMIE